MGRGPLTETQHTVPFNERLRIEVLGKWRHDIASYNRPSSLSFEGTHCAVAPLVVIISENLPLIVFAATISPST